MPWVSEAFTTSNLTSLQSRLSWGCVDTARVAAVEQFHLASPGQEFPHLLPGKGILFCLDGLQRAALPELKVIAEVELQGFEDLQAALSYTDSARCKNDHRTHRDYLPLFLE